MDEQKKLKILIIDDDNFLLDMYALKFGQAGFEVVTALGSQIAYDQLKNGLVVDVILTDIVMPIMSGFELLQKMKDENLSSNSIKILLSNRGQQSDINQGKDIGVAGYIIKANNTPSEVIEKVHDIIKKSN